MVGYRARVSAELFDEGLRMAVEPGHRSMLFVFERLGDDEPPMSFGAIVEEVFSGGVAGGALDAVIWFWAELAEIYASAGTEFELWYGDLVVGRGEVIHSIDELAGLGSEGSPTVEGSSGCAVDE